LRAAAEQAKAQGTDLCHLADLLRPRTSRLSTLERPGTSVAERIASEVDKLPPPEQRALAVLTLVESQTFLPGVLTALLSVHPVEAENLVVRLSDAQMLMDLGPDGPTGLGRYGFHPLVRLYAQAAVDTHFSRAELDRARDELDEAYRQVIGAVLHRIDPTLDPPGSTNHLPADSVIAQIAGAPERWIRAEYPALLRAIMLSSRDDPGLCWRIAAHLDGCVPPVLDARTSLTAYDTALAAAKRDGAPTGQIRVLLAKGTFLVALERYPQAMDTLGEVLKAVSRLQQSTRDGGVAELLRIEALAHRKLGEGYLQSAALSIAVETLNAAYRLATACGDESERDLIRLLRAEAHRMYGPDPETADGRAGDAWRFRAHLLHSESARRKVLGQPDSRPRPTDGRRPEWKDAREQLDRAMKYGGADARRTASVHYRLARLYLDEHLVNGWPDFATGQGVDDPNELSLAEQAARRAAAAAVMFHQMGNRVGVLRARCQLARALAVGGYLVEAEQAAYSVVNDLRVLGAAAGVAARPLQARLARTLGDIMICRGDQVGGRRLLLRAATVFGELGDWGSEQDAVRRLRDVRWFVPNGVQPNVLDDPTLWDKAGDNPLEAATPSET
jgi:tetratricopeptide (TPR) repeat protein